MKRRSVLSLASALAMLAASVSSAAPASVASMTWSRRILLVASPGADDPSATRQARLLADWRDGAAARDLTLVQVMGDAVSGASDAATSLRRRYRLPFERFEVVLIGKDGRVAFRSARPVAASILEATIDAMPMRRAGRR